MSILAKLLGKEKFDREDRAKVLEGVLAILNKNQKNSGEMTLQQAIAAALEGRGKWTAERERELYLAVGEAIGLKPDAFEEWLKKVSFKEKETAINKALRYL